MVTTCLEDYVEERIFVKFERNSSTDVNLILCVLVLSYVQRQGVVDGVILNRSSGRHHHSFLSTDNCVFVSHSYSVPIDVCHVRYLNVLSFCCHCHVLQQQLTITQR